MPALDPAARGGRKIASAFVRKAVPLKRGARADMKLMLQSQRPMASVRAWGMSRMREYAGG